MHYFHRKDGSLYCEGVDVAGLARRYGTPLYVYSQRTIAEHFLKLDQALAPLNHLVCYAVKANSNLAILRLLAGLGSGFDIVSEGELRRVLAAGGKANKCVFAGVGKSEREIEFALRQGIYCFNVESEPELDRIHQVSRRLRKVAPVAIRVNPNVKASTHAKITTGTYENKFGIAFEDIPRLYARASRLTNLRPRGVQMHIGSQLLEVGPFEQAVRKLVPLVRELSEKYSLEFFSIGGGLGIVYEDALASGGLGWWQSRRKPRPMTSADYAAALAPLLQPLGLRILVEPGRFIVGNAGILLTRVEFVKRTGKKNFVIVDAAMNDLIRPAFYEAYHEIVPVRPSRRKPTPCDVVGPICESGDAFCKDRPLAPAASGELLAVLSAGAYGFVMASNYNSRPLAAEVLVHGPRSALIRERQPVQAIWMGEAAPPWMTEKRARRGRGAAAASRRRRR